MTPRASLPPRYALRRLLAALAIFAVAFGSTLGSAAHVIAMPAMAAAAADMAAGGHDHGQAGSDDHGAQAADHHSTDAASAKSTAKAPGPCEQGCLLCKDCFLSSFVLIAPMDFNFGIHYTEYAAAEPRLGDGITPARLPEPPRA